MLNTAVRLVLFLSSEMLKPVGAGGAAEETINTWYILVLNNAVG